MKDKADIYSPVGIFLAVTASRDDEPLLFRYPNIPDSGEHSGCLTLSIPLTVSHYHQVNSRTHYTVRYVAEPVDTRYNDAVLGKLLAISDSLCDKPFVLKIMDVRFVGFPIRVPHAGAGSGGQAGGANAKSGHSEERSARTHLSAVHVVFQLRAKLSGSILESFHELSRSLAVALLHEEARCGYLSEQRKLMIGAKEECNVESANCSATQKAAVADSTEQLNAYERMLKNKACTLAQQLRRVFKTLCQSGTVEVHVNGWIRVSACVPQILYARKLPTPGQAIHPAGVQRCLQALRPYHGFLLLESAKNMLEQLPADCSHTLIRLLRASSPHKSLHTLSLDADIALSHVFELVCHLVYWAKAVVIYPPSASNVYVLSTDTQLHLGSHVSQKFQDAFPGLNFHAVLSGFSFPTRISEHKDSWGLPRPDTLAQHGQVVTWLLKHRVIIQLHTYVFLAPPERTQSSDTSSGKSAKESGQMRHSSGNNAALSSLSNSSAAPTTCDNLEQPPDQTTSSATGEKVDVQNVAKSDQTIISSVAETSVTTSNSSSPGTFVGQSKTEPVLVGSGAGGIAGAASGGGVAGTTSSGGVGGAAASQKLLAQFETPPLRAAVSEIPASSCFEDLRLFTRLYTQKYLTGAYHLETMMYYENLTRSQLNTILLKYSRLLVTADLPDPACTLDVVV